MKMKHSRRRFFQMRNDPPAGDGEAANGGAPAGDGAPPASKDTLLPSGEGAGAGEGGEGGTPPGEHDWLPEKYRVNGDDGALDEAASSRKLADAYKALESKLGKAAALPPATPDEYKLTPPEGLPPEAFEQFTGDELFKNFTKEAHEAGLTNDQLQFVTQKYLALAPELMGADKQLSADEAKAELAKVWNTDESMKQGLGSVVRAINAFGAEGEDVPGSRARLMEKYGTDPDFIAFAAQVAGELKEDQLPNGQAVSADADIDALMKSEAYWKADHPEHEKAKAKVSAHFARKHGTASRRSGVAR